jgi:hypothetical protein
LRIFFLNRNYLDAFKKQTIILNMAKKRRKITPKTPIRVSLTFTKKQIEHIDELVDSGELGSNRGSVLQSLSMEFVRDWRRKRS